MPCSAINPFIRRRIMKIQNTIGKYLSFVAVILLAAFAASAQTTAFSYQGRLTDTGILGNGSFQMRFRLFDAASGGTPQGNELINVPVTVTQGNFSLKLDFGASVFTGADRWIEVAVRRNAGESYTTLDPRDKIVSSPYSLRTLSAAQADDAQKLGGVNAGEYVTASNAAGNSFIKNQTTQQAASNFNVSGAGTVGTLNANGAVNLAGIAAPATAPAGQARVYFDSGTNKFRISENGGAFVNLVGATGVSGSGTINKLPFWSAATTLADSVIAQTGTNIGIGTTSPTSKLDVRGSLTLDQGASPILYTGTAAVEQNRYLQLINSTTVQSASGLKAGGILVSDNYTFANPGKNDLIVKGNVGVGTAAPTTPLSVLAPTYGISHTDGTRTLSTYLNTSGGWFGTTTNHPLHFFTNDGGQAMTITPAGLVGIGNTSPTHALDVYGFFRATHPAGGNVVSETTGGVNSWAKLWMRTPVQSWSIGSSNTFLGNQLYFANESAATILMSIMPNGNVGIGTANPTAKLDVSGTTRTGVLQITGGSDLAENFEIDRVETVKPGMLVAIDPDKTGKLVLARGAYNRRVVGIVSGANGLGAGMLLPDPKNAEGALPVALSGRAWVYADANKYPIRPGDMLTTSEIPGYAMRAVSSRRASGAVIGKAMTELRSGAGLVLVFVTLQ